MLAFSAGLSILTALVFGLAPAISASRTDPVDSLKSGGPQRRRQPALDARRPRRERDAALAVALLVGAGLLIKSFSRLSHVNPGFATADRLAARTILPNPKYADAAPKVDFFDRALERLRALPGVESAALTSILPISGSDEIYSIVFEGRPPLPPGQGVSAIYYLVSPDYFATMGIPVLRGGRSRIRIARERRASRSSTRRSFGCTIATRSDRPADPDGPELDIVREIVGVVGNVKYYGSRTRPCADVRAVPPVPGRRHVRSC